MMNIIKSFETILKSNDLKNLSSGEKVAVRSYRDSKQKEFENLVIEDLWKNDVAELVKCLRDNGINNFLLTDESTALMDELFEFQDNDCKIGHLLKVKSNEIDFHGNKREYKGILIYVNQE